MTGYVTNAIVGSLEPATQIQHPERRYGQMKTRADLDLEA